MRHVLISAIAILSLCLPAYAVEQVVPSQQPLMTIPSMPSQSQFSLGDNDAKKGYTLNDDLIYRINFGRVEDVKFLLDKGADPNARTKQGDPVLSVAIDRNDDEAIGMVKALLEKGADPNGQDRAKNYPIVSATKNGQPAIVAALIDKGADFLAKSSSGTSLLDLAKINGNPELIKIIGAEIKKEDLFAADLRKPERYKKILSDYAYDNCLYQYWKYFVISNQNPSRDDEAKSKMAKSKTAISLIVKQIQRYYPFTTTAELTRIATASVNEVYDQLDAMISNSNRNEHGVGNEGDDVQRCEKVVAGIELNVAVPQGYLLPVANAP